jgi:adenylate kinase family enzyme
MNIDTVDQPKSNPILIMVRGVPGGGKSYVTAKLVEAIGEENVVVLDPDAIDKTSKEYIALSESLTREDVNENLHPYRFLRSKAYQGIETNKIIIWNQGFMDLDGFNKTVINLTSYALDHSTMIPTLVVEVEVNGETSKKRIADRVARGGHDVPEEVLKRFIDQYRSFADEGYNVVTVDGEGDVDVSVAAITQALNSL